MSTEAIIMMAVAMLVLWGGLILAIVNLSVRSRADEMPETEIPHRDL